MTLDLSPMPSEGLLAAFVDDDALEVALSVGDQSPSIRRFANDPEGIADFTEWALPLIGDGPLRVCATVPKGDGGYAYEWLYENIPELFLQNPTRLQEYAKEHSVPWQSAVTLHDFNKSKRW